MVSKLEDQIIERVIRARESAGLGRDDVARALSLNPNSYGHYERRRSAFTVEQLFQLSRILGKPVEYFLGLPTTLTEDEQELLYHWRTCANEDIKRFAFNALKEAPKKGG